MRVRWGIAAVLVVGFTSFAADARTARPVLCDGHLPTISGTSGNDVIVGTPHRDVIAAYGGDDLIDGAGGNDIICGGQGTDTATYASAPAGVTVDLAAGTATGNGSDRLTGIENVVGSPYSDTLTGDS